MSERKDLDSLAGDPPNGELEGAALRAVLEDDYEKAEGHLRALSWAELVRMRSACLVLAAECALWMRAQ